MKLHLPIGPEHTPPKGLFNEAERKRFVMLTVMMVMVVGMFIYGWFKSTRSSAPAPTQDLAASSGVPRAEIVTPEVDVEALRALTSDATPEERVLIETAALELVLRTCRLIGPDHFEPMGGRLMDNAVAAELLEQPDAHRGDLLRTYGVIEAIDAFDASGNTSAHYRGRLRLEDGGTIWFAVLALPNDWGEVGHFVRIDGLFLEIYREQAGRDWIDAPLIVGQRAVRAYPELEAVTELDPMLFVNVEDDSAEGITGQPYDAYWALVSYAKNVPEGAIDWDAAPLLEHEELGRLFEDGSSGRGQPFRIPVTEAQAVYHMAQPENPVRIDRLVEGWAGSWEWARGPAKVIQFVAPIEHTDLKRGDYFTGRGFFLKNLSYEPRDGGVAVVPFFVLHSIESYTPVKTDQMGKIFAGIAFGLLLTVVLVYVSLMRDRRKARELQDALRRRRQARRAQPQET